MNEAAGQLSRTVGTLSSTVVGVGGASIWAVGSATRPLGSVTGSAVGPQYGTPGWVCGSIGGARGDHAGVIAHFAEAAREGPPVSMA